MKLYLLSLLVLFSSLSFAQKKIEVDSEIKSVTVFLNGAQVKRAAKSSLVAGRNTIHFTGLPLSLDQKSILFNTNAPVTVFSINHQITYKDESAKDSSKIKVLQKRMKQLGYKAENLESTYRVYYQEKQILVKNTNFGGSKKGVSVLELEKGVNLLRSRQMELDQKLLSIEKETEALNLERQKLIVQLEKYRNQSAIKSGEVVIVLNCDAAMKADLNLTYMVSQASWKPYYDLKVKDTDSPLELIYKAKVVQNTGEDWKKVKISLSTGDPSKDGQIQFLMPWFLNFTNQRYTSTRRSREIASPGISGKISGIVTDASTQESVVYANIIAKNDRGEIVSSTTSNFDGKFELNLIRPCHIIEISYLGYQKQRQYLNAQLSNYRINLFKGSNDLAEIEVPDFDNSIYEELEPRASYGAGGISIKGSRADATAYFVDGVKVRESVNIPQSSIQMQEIQMSGVPAQYGDVQGGIVSTTNTLAGVSSGKRKQTAIMTRNPTTFNFTVSEPYDIPSDASDYVVDLQSFSLDADYLYNAVPKMEEHAYLTASLTDWEKLSLRNGNAGIYYEGTYMGETFLNVEAAGDTLHISLGKDEDIVIKREEIISKEDIRLVSRNKEETFHYRISIRNNKQNKIRLSIKDQYPISANDDIKVKEIESSNGKVNSESKLIEWDLELNPSEEKDLNLKYRVSYPKTKTINLY